MISMQNEIKMTEEEITKSIEEHVNNITQEFKQGFEFMKKYPKSVTIFGSSRLTTASSHYHDAKRLAERIVKETGYSIITGGGPGIMEATNLGAKEAGGMSLGLNITLPYEQHLNPYATDSMVFKYFFTRKAMLTFEAEAYVFFPGGFGTFDELFSILTLMQTKKITPVPIILFGKDFWNPVKEMIENTMLKEHHTIEEKDIDLFVITNSIDEAIKIIKGSPVSEWSNMIG